MNKTERAALRKMLKSIEHPGVTAAEYDSNFRRVKDNKDSMKLLDSKEYKEGHNYCRDRVKQIVEFILKGNTADIKKYVGRGE